MSRQTKNVLALLLVVLVALTGCHPTQPFYLHEDGDLSHYLGAATEIDYPDVETASLEEVTGAKSPFTLSNPEFDEIWDLSLEECVSIALQNSKVARTSSGTLFPQSNNPAVASTVYDPAIVESTPGQFFGRQPAGQLVSAASMENQGVEAALSEFDAKIDSSIFWEKVDRPSNVLPSGFFPSVLQQDTAAFRAQVSKKTAAGTELFFRNVTDYDHGNSRGGVGPGRNQALSSIYTTAFEVEARQPLLQGRGTQINRIPIVVARIGSDISLASFETSVRKSLLDMEERYWDLHCAYRNLETSKTGRDSALITWRIVYEKWKQGVEPVQAEAQSREQYFFFRSQVETALSDLQAAENRLRFLMGLAATDGRLIRPSDEPTTAKVNFDWNEIHSESVVRRSELRQQKWEIKRRELEVIYARNRLLPQFNAVALYRWLGVGDELIGADRVGSNFPAVGSRAFDELTEGNYQELRFGVELEMPVGFRRELAGVRHAQLRVARETAILEDMELEVSHKLTEAIRTMDSSYQLAQTHFNRWAASEKEVESVEALYKGGKATLDLVLDAQRRRAQSEIAYYQALCDHSKAIADVHNEKGSLLEYSNVHLAEGPWPQKAYDDAMGLARQRDASTYLNYGWSRPSVVSQGPAPLGSPSMETIEESVIEMPEELIPTPAEVLPEVPAGEMGKAHVVPNTDSANGPELISPVVRAGDRDATMGGTDGGRKKGSSSSILSNSPAAIGSGTAPAIKIQRIDESVKNQSADQANRSSAGWKGSQR